MNDGMILCMCRTLHIVQRLMTVVVLNEAYGLLWEELQHIYFLQWLFNERQLWEHNMSFDSIKFAIEIMIINNENNFSGDVLKI